MRVGFSTKLQCIPRPLRLTEWMLSGYTKYTTRNLVSRVLGNCSLQVVSCGPLQALGIRPN